MVKFLCLLICCVVARAVKVDDDKIDLSHFGLRMFGEPIPNNERNRARRFGNPEEHGPYLEGDLLIPYEGRNGISLESARWPNREIPYEIQRGFSKFFKNLNLGVKNYSCVFIDQNEVKRIQQAFNEYHTKTCIKFIPRRQSDQNYISIENNPTGCWSSVGKIGGKQVVNLQSSSCLQTIGTPLHELLHAVGFMHEQNREERDGFVTIRNKNIESGMEKNFEKAQKGAATAFGVPYDYGSVMHYSSVAFSKNGQPTIEAKQKTSERMGQRDGFSKSDLEKIKKMYKC